MKLYLTIFNVHIKGRQFVFVEFWKRYGPWHFAFLQILDFNCNKYIILGTKFLYVYVYKTRFNGDNNITSVLPLMLKTYKHYTILLP